MSEGTTKAPPALFDHCVRTYNLMLREARPVQLQEPTSGGQSQMIVYEGYFTQLVTGQLNLSVPYFSSVSKALQNMGCIRQLKRGGGTAQSQWELICEPTLDAFTESQPKKTRKPSRDEILQEQIDTLNGRLHTLEDTVNDLVAAWAREYGTKKVEG